MAITLNDVEEFCRQNKLALISIENVMAFKKLYDSGFVSSALLAIEKIAKIELIADAYITDNPKEPYYDTEVYMDRIIEVLKDEKK